MHIPIAAQCREGNSRNIPSKRAQTVAQIPSSHLENKRGRASAFTLVELLVVIGVIALLISILLPSLARAQQMGRKTKCLNTLRQLGTCNQMYLAEYKDWEIPCRWGYSQSAPPAPPSPAPPVPASGPARSWANVWYLAKFFSS